MRQVGSTLLLLSLLFCGAVRAQDANDAGQNIFAALAARNTPSQLQGKDLTAAWRVMRADETLEQNVLLQMLGTPQRNETSPWSPFYYTRGDVLAVGGQIYLIAYSVQPPQSREERERKIQYLRAMQDDSNEVTLKERPLPLEESTPLILSLLSLSGDKSLREITAFDPDKDLLTAFEKTKRETKVERLISQQNLKQVGLGLLQYVQDYDEKMPPMRAAKSAAQITAQINMSPNSTSPVQVVLFPYVRTTQIFLHPKTGRPYLPNYKISRLSLAAINNPATTIAFYEDAPDAEGKRNISFVDGHVKAFSEAEFQRMRKAQGISESGLPSVAKNKKVAMRRLEEQNKIHRQQTTIYVRPPGAPPGYVVSVPPAAPAR